MYIANAPMKTPLPKNLETKAALPPLGSVKHEANPALKKIQGVLILPMTYINDMR